jgi:hypothetical protein
MNLISTNGHWQPAMTVKPDGTKLFVAWYDRRADTASNSLVQIWGAFGNVPISTNSFTNNFLISTAQFPPIFSGTNINSNTFDPVYPPIFQPSDSEYCGTFDGKYAPHMGDYDMAASDNNFAYYTWLDGRNSCIMSIAVPTPGFRSEPGMRDWVRPTTRWPAWVLVGTANRRCSIPTAVKFFAARQGATRNVCEALNLSACVPFLSRAHGRCWRSEQDFCVGAIAVKHDHFSQSSFPPRHLCVCLFGLQPVYIHLCEPGSRRERGCSSLRLGWYPALRNELCRHSSERRPDSLAMSFRGG